MTASSESQCSSSSDRYQSPSYGKDGAFYSLLRSSQQLILVLEPSSPQTDDALETGHVSMTLCLLPVLAQILLRWPVDSPLASLESCLLVHVDALGEPLAELMFCTETSKHRYVCGARNCSSLCCFEVCSH